MQNDGRTARTEHPVDGEEGGAATDTASGARAIDTSSWLPSAYALLAASLGIAVLAGWQFDIPLITNASPGGIAMAPLAAAGLVLGSAALWLIQPPRATSARRGLGNVLAGLLTALGIAVLIEHLARVDLGIDLLLFGGDLAALGGRWPGRPSLHAGAAFTLVGAALLSQGGGGRLVRIAQWLALTAFLVSTVAVLGFLYRVPELYRPLGGPPIPLHGALGAMLLSLGVLLGRRRVGIIGALTGSDVGGLAARRLLPIGVLLPVLLGALVAEAVRTGGLDAARGFFLVGGLLSIAFAALVWRSALVLRDIDRERRRAARGLSQSEQRFRSLAENASDAMITIDSRSAIVFANPAAERLFGYTVEQLTQMNLTSLMPARFREAHRDAMHRFERAGTRRLDWGGAQFIGLRRDGVEIPLEITLGDYVRDERRYFTGIIRDITERRHAETAQRLLVEAGRVLSASLDPDATLRGVTRLTVAELADWCVVYGGENGVMPLELAARDLVREVRLRELERRYPPRDDTPVREMMRRGEPLLLPDVDAARLRELAWAGDEHLELLSEVGCGSLLAVPLETRGHTIGALVLGAAPGGRRFGERDVATARELGVRIAFAVDNARLYEQARAAREQAEARARAIERMTDARARLLRGFSHDLKNPLGAADGHADLLESGVLGSLTRKQKDSVGRIRNTISATLALIDDLVELARTESGQIELNLGAVDIGPIVSDVADEHRPRAEAKGLRLDVELATTRHALADAARVRQVIANLVTNAIKYTQEGAVVLRVAEGGDGAPSPDAWLRVDVIDTGPGIAADDQARMFEEFTRLGGETPGAGLGLAISRNLAEALGGAITLHSSPGEGCRFTLWLRPAAAPARARVPEAAATSATS